VLGGVLANVSFLPAPPVVDDLLRVVHVLASIYFELVRAYALPRMVVHGSGILLRHSFCGIIQVDFQLNALIHLISHKHVLEERAALIVLAHA